MSRHCWQCDVDTADVGSLLSRLMSTSTGPPAHRGGAKQASHPGDGHFLGTSPAHWLLVRGESGCTVVRPSVSQVHVAAGAAPVSQAHRGNVSAVEDSGSRSEAGGDGTHPGKVFRNLRGVYSTLYDCKYHSQRQVHYPLNLYELSFNIYLTKTMLRLMRNYGVLQVCWTIFCA